jgi:hypothetical protein
MSNQDKPLKEHRKILTASVDPTIFYLFAERTRNLNRSKVVEALIAHWMAAVLPEVRGVAEMARPEFQEGPAVSVPDSASPVDSGSPVYC